MLLTLYYIERNLIMAGKKSPREWQKLTDVQMAKKLKMSLEDFHDLTGRDEDILKTYEEIGGVVPRKNKKGGAIKRKRGGVAKKQVGGLTQGYDARLDESLAARHPAVVGNLAARRAESEGMERALRRGPYSGARTMAKKGGSVRRKKGGTASRGKIMQGYKAGGKV